MAAQNMGSPAGNSHHVNADISGNFKYIYDIPQLVKKRLADLLDQDAKWVGLALRQMGYSAEDVEVWISPDIAVFKFTNVLFFFHRVLDDVVLVREDRLAKVCL